MKRFSLILFGLLLAFGLVTSVVVAQRAAPIRLDSLKQCGDCKPTDTPPPQSPVPQSGGNNTPNPGDPDGDGIPGGIDQCPAQGGPSSNSGCPPGQEPTALVPAAPTSAPAVVLPTMPITGDCVLATRSDQAVNVRAEPSTSAAIVGVLDPQTLYPVLAVLNNAEGVWDRIAAGWVARRVMRLGGNCKALPMVDETGANVAPARLSHPDGSGFALADGAAPGADLKVGFCTTKPFFALDWHSGSSVTVDFPLGAGNPPDPYAQISPDQWCAKADTDGQGVVTDWTPGATDPPNPRAQDIAAHWYAGLGANHELVILAIFQPVPLGTGGHRSPSIDAHHPQAVVTAWHIPFDPKANHVILHWNVSAAITDTHLTGGGIAPCVFVAINWSLTDPPDPDKPGMSINWSLADPPDPDKQGESINWFPNGLDGIAQAIGAVNAALGDPPDPDKPGFAIGDAQGAHAFIVVQFPLPAIR